MRAFVLGLLTCFKGIDSYYPSPSYRIIRKVDYRLYSGYSRSGTKAVRNEKKLDELTQVKLLCRMIVVKSEANDYRYSLQQIEDRLKKLKTSVNTINPETGISPLRYAIRSSRRDIVLLLLKYGGKANSYDKEGFILQEVLQSINPGMLSILTDILEYCELDNLTERVLEQIAPSRYCMVYWLNRSRRHILPQDRLEVLEIPRLHALKYRIVGQPFALEQVLSEVASHRVNSELSSKPLVMLFSGPPGHGKTETAKQLSQLLDAPFVKIDCRNHANSWEMFGSGVGYIGSESGSQLGNFMELHQGKRSVILLDEFDFCDAGTWEGFYHVFDEGEYTLKKTPLHDSTARGSPTTRILDCSKTIFLLTTNKFDDDIDQFYLNNFNFIQKLQQPQCSNSVYETLRVQFEEYIRPKLRNFFKGGLTRRIDTIIPFFRFSEEEAYVVAAMYVDKLREMYSKPPTRTRKVGNIDFDVTDYALGELSKGYNAHKLDGASSIRREVNSQIIKPIHLQWIRKSDMFSAEPKDSSELGRVTVYIHFDKKMGLEWVLSSALPEGAMTTKPYFLETSFSTDSATRGNGVAEEWLLGGVDDAERELDEEAVREEEELRLLEDWKDPFAHPRPFTGGRSEEVLTGTTAALATVGREIHIDSHEGEISAPYEKGGKLSIIDSLESDGASWEEGNEEAKDGAAYVKTKEEVVGQHVNIPPTDENDHHHRLLLRKDVLSFEEVAGARSPSGVLVNDGRSQAAERNSDATIKNKSEHITEDSELSGGVQGETIVDDSDAGERSPHQMPSSVTLKVLFIDNLQGVTLGTINTSLAMSDVIRLIGSELRLAEDRKEFRTWIRSKAASLDTRLELETDINLYMEDGSTGTGVASPSVERAMTTDLTDSDGSWTFIRFPDKISVSSAIQNSSFDLQKAGYDIFEVLVEMKSGKRWPRDAELNLWRKALQVGDVLDAVLPSTKEWKEARVIRIEKYDSASYAKEPMVFVHFLGYSSLNDTAYTTSSPFLKPLYSQSIRWRDGLRVGDEVDVRLTQDTWVAGKVEEALLERDEVKLQIMSFDTVLRQSVSWSGEDICPKYTHTKPSSNKIKDAIARSRIRYSGAWAKSQNTSSSGDQEVLVIDVDRLALEESPQTRTYRENLDLEDSTDFPVIGYLVTQFSETLDFSFQSSSTVSDVIKSLQSNASWFDPSVETRFWWFIRSSPSQIYEYGDSLHPSKNEYYRLCIDQVGQKGAHFCRHPHLLTLYDILASGQEGNKEEIFQRIRNLASSAVLVIIVEAKQEKGWSSEDNFNYWRTFLGVNSYVDAWNAASNRWEVARVARIESYQESIEGVRIRYSRDGPRSIDINAIVRALQDQLLKSGENIELVINPTVPFEKNCIVHLEFLNNNLIMERGEKAVVSYYNTSRFIQPLRSITLEDC